MSESNTPRCDWPRTLGTIGIVLGALIFLDQIDDLWMQLTWTEEEWRLFFSPELAALMADALRPAGWQMASALVQMGLGLLLVAGSLGLRRHRRSGVSLCRAWAWLAVVFAIVDIGWAVSLLSRHSGTIPGVSVTGWQTATALGIGFALVLLLAYPVFLLAWFGRPRVEAEYSSWVE